MLLASALLLAACSARFVDERPASTRDASALDAAARDAATTPRDGGASVVDLYGVGPFATGPFVGAGGHDAAGGAALFRDSDGVIELRFDAAFQIGGVDHATVVLSARDALGGALDPVRDIDLGPLEFTEGAQVYTLSRSDAGGDGTDGGRRRAFLYDKPTGLVAARAVLTP